MMTTSLPRRVPRSRVVDGGFLLPGFVDAHVHLGLVDAAEGPAALRAGGIAGVDDLGWDPAVATGWLGAPGLPHVRVAGAFLAAPGGYPADRPWAPPSAVVPVASPEEAEAAVARQTRCGASYVKVTLHTGGPLLDDATLAAVVRVARARGVTVVAHTEGPGQVVRALKAGVDRLAHTPWTERLPDAVVEEAAVRQVWVSTLDVHGWGAPDARQEEQRETALDNLRRFHTAGGAVAYGTDLGNGPLPVGLNVRELRALCAAGLEVPAVLRALTSRPVRGLATFVPGAPFDASTGIDELTERLADATVVVDPARTPPPQEDAP
ncbi:amidohydrolase family protein [Isoptericola sp. NEAU-Y5]|uniref:Amidohydrolase family protein n=1 Tax=Isoptericola luteus TaxID=2879484 RepID=A0ABS7ZG63_9MICO|nr:amidohydrolase family protein [Isoptericola sp. NEAU-Y5]MCA5894011.1 amidohydrolase family protein [Isoptericola sp. NEAU-Y5]